jgi:hypothetical protein
MPQMNDTISRHRLFRQTPHPATVDDFFHVFNSPNILKVAYCYEYFSMLPSVPGSIVECGVGRGSLLTLMGLESLFRTFDGYTPRRNHGLDSFEGFPEPTAEDASPRNPKKGEWSNSPNGQFDYSIPNLLKIISVAGIEQTVLDDLVLIKGFFSETAKQVSAEAVAQFIWTVICTPPSGTLCTHWRTKWGEEASPSLMIFCLPTLIRTLKPFPVRDAQWKSSWHSTQILN